MISARLDVDAALQLLPEDQRAAVVLRDLLDLDYAEIAEVLAIPIGTVRSRIARGRGAIASLLSPGHTGRRRGARTRLGRRELTLSAGASKETRPMTEDSSPNTEGAADGHLDDETLSASIDAELEAGEASGAARHLAGVLLLRGPARVPFRCGRSCEHAGRAATGGRPAAPARKCARGHADASGRPVEPVSTDRQLTMAHAAAALLILIGGGAAVWHFRTDGSGGASSSAMSSSTTSTIANRPAGRAGRPAISGTALQLRLADGKSYKGCKPPPAHAQNPSRADVALYDASVSTRWGEATCSPLGSPVFTITGATGARVVGSASPSLASLIVSVPAASAHTARSLLLQHGGPAVAVVLGGEVIGYLSTGAVAGRTVTIVGVPTSIAGKVAAELRRS